MGNEVYYTLRADGMDEVSRLRYRDEIRAALAAIEIERYHIAEFEAVIAAANDDSEAAATEHAILCEPAQAALTAADEKTLNAIRAKQPIPPEVGADRVAALKIIADANAALEARTQANRATIKAMTAEINKARLKLADQGPLQTALINLASPALQQQSAVIGDRLDWARKRFTHARAGVELNARRIEGERNHPHPDPRHIASYNKQQQAHQAMADDAAAQVAALETELAAIREAMLAE